MKHIFILLAIVGISGCGIMKTAEDTRDEVKKSNENQARMLHVVERQPFALAEEKFLKLKEFYIQHPKAISLRPPVALYPYAKTFCEEGTPEQLINYAQVLYVHINKVESIEAARFDFATFETIAASTPESKMAAILNEHVTRPSTLAEVAKAYAMVRYVHIREYFLKPLMEARNINADHLRKAAHHFRQLKMLSDFSKSSEFRAEFATIGYSENFPVGEIVQLGAEAKRKFQFLAPPSSEMSKFLVEFDVKR